MGNGSRLVPVRRSGLGRAGRREALDGSCHYVTVCCQHRHSHDVTIRLVAQREGLIWTTSSSRWMMMDDD